MNRFRLTAALPATAFSAFAICSMSCEPRRREYTICTAVAPQVVFTVRTNGDTGPPYGPPPPPISVQIPAPAPTNPQVKTLSPPDRHDREPSQVSPTPWSSFDP
jgi:hypothetical protein